MKLSLVIPVFNGLDYLELLLDSVHRYSTEEHEIVVYSDGSTDGTADFLRGLSRVSARHSPVNEGVCTAVNRAVQMATGQYVFLLNTDHVLPPNWDVEISRWLGANRIVSTTCIEPGIVPVASFFVRCNCGRSWRDFQWERFESAAQEAYKPCAAPGVNHPFVIAKTLWDRVGGLDERFNPGPASDPDLFYRLCLEGVLMIRAENVALYHFSGKSSRMANESPVELASWRAQTDRCNRAFIDKWGEYYRYEFGGLPNPGPSARTRYVSMAAQTDMAQASVTGVQPPPPPPSAPDPCGPR